jgi:hypothetical protein
MLRAVLRFQDPSPGPQVVSEGWTGGSIMVCQRHTLTYCVARNTAFRCVGDHPAIPTLNAAYVEHHISRSTLDVRSTVIPKRAELASKPRGTDSCSKALRHCQGWWEAIVQPVLSVCFASIC